jgi:cholesterol oxidase
MPRGPWGSRKLLRNVRANIAGRTHDWVINRDGLYEVHRFASMTVLGGSGVGGGSHVYAGIQRPPASEFWTAFPQEITARDMSHYFDRVRAMQRPAPSPEPALAERAVPRALRRAGMTVEVPDLAIDWDSCLRCGQCVLGCEHRAKTTLDLTYLPAATAAGAEVWPLCEAVRIELCGNGFQGNGFQIAGTDHRTRTAFTVRADRLVVAAGTLNTVRLLFVARDRDRTLPGLSRSLGRRFTGNADYPLLVKPSAPTEPSSGALVNACALPLAADRYYVDADIPVPVASAALRRVVGRYRLLVGMGAVASVRGPRRRLMSAHPLGGAAMADSAADGVVDHAGRVFGYPRLYVADGSMLPTAPGVPPSMTIAALAERNAELMLQEA